MPLDFYDYKNLTDYLQHLYQCKPFTRNGIEHPVTVYYPSEAQIHDVDSILDPYLPTQEKTDYAFYDYSYLHDLQNSKPSLFNGRTFTLNFIRTILRGSRRSAAIGIGTLTVFNDAGTYKAILAKRSNKTAFDSGMYHVLPAMMFQPTTPDFKHPQEWSIKHQVMREVLEEMFDMPEQLDPDAWDFFYQHPALVYLQELMDAGKAQLYVTGIILNLLTLRPEVSTLLLIRDPEWYARIRAKDSDIPFKTADETVGASEVIAPIATDEDFLAYFPDDLYQRMPAQATATLWLGIDLARKEILTG